MGDVTFSGVELRTLPGDVMVPRPASERVAEVAAARIGDGPARVADVGTGSGAIAIALAQTAPNAEIWATDLSASAVLLARTNAHRLGLADRLHVVKGDLLESIPGPLDLVVANLPYLPSHARALHPELATEPPHAVFAAGDGLDPYRRLLGAARHRLSSDGAVVAQLHRRVIVVERDDLSCASASLPELVRELLAAPPGAIAAPCGAVAVDAAA
jgi:release factor glutamine methyltransferase